MSNSPLSTVEPINDVEVQFMELYGTLHIRRIIARIRAEQAEKALITKQRDKFFSMLSDEQFKEEEQ